MVAGVCGRWQWNNGWLWVVVGGGGEVMAGRGWSHDLVMPMILYMFEKFTGAFVKWVVTEKTCGNCEKNIM